MPVTFFLVTSRYTAPADTIGARLADHRVWLGELYDRGHVILSGRLASGRGGFMLMRGIERQNLDPLLATDPLRAERLLVHDVQEFAANRWCGALDTMLGTP